MLERITPDTELVSFDLWLTLIKSNGRNFKNIRNAHMGSLLAPHMLESDFDEVVRAQDKMADKIAESRGQDVLFGERVRLVAKAVGAAEPSESMLEELYEYQGKLFQKNLPLLLDDSTPKLLDQIKDSGRELAIISNTGYMHGDQMRLALDAIGIGQKFEYKIFSNEVGYAKPDSRIFQRLLDMSGVEASHITHIGDNARADVLGATQIGMQAIHMVGDVSLRSIIEGSV